MNSISEIYRIYVEKKTPYDVEAKGLLNEVRSSLALDGLLNLRLLNRYDISGVTKEELERALNTVFAEPPVDEVYLEEFDAIPGDYLFGMEYLPGQFDQRADSAARCLQIISQRELPLVHFAKIIILEGSLTEEQLKRIKAYCINPVDSREADLAKPESLALEAPEPQPVSVLEGFIDLDYEASAALFNALELAMNKEDFFYIQEYFKNTEKRNPTLTEIRVIDTYWSDHCRHTTFLTKINSVYFDKGHFNDVIEKSYEKYLSSREFTYLKEIVNKPVCLMDLATIAMKELHVRGVLDDLDISDEINACSIKIDVEVDGKTEPWLLMFKNETHNHPTEIEPFGGASTCLGGAIRDPLSGRTYVYQALRLTGSGDPRQSLADTLTGKLPQRKITKEAAKGNSSYGNQIGVAAGQAVEVYDDGFVAKRMELGALIAAAPQKNIYRAKPIEGDAVILLGGRTGRDGCGGATGSSKEHDEKSLASCSAEVQKGNPLIERNILRLFRKPEASTLIKKCNDFGAGGVSVAIGELADSLKINLDAVPVKYAGMDGTELAISESQERMAVVIAKENIEKFTRLAHEENLEATVVAEVTSNGRLEIFWRGDKIVDISRDFLNSSGIRQEIDISIASPKKDENFFLNLPEYADENTPIKEAWLANLSSLNNACQKGMAEYFDATAGGSTVLMPFGGKHQLTPAPGMAAKLPVLEGESKTASLMTYGYSPGLAKWSPYHGAMYAVVSAMSKIVAMGGSPHGLRLTFQEFFEKLGKDPYKWGKPLAALLGAYEAQMRLTAPAIGGKDSMSGSFMDINVPPTLVAFAVGKHNDASQLLSPEFKKPGSHVILIPILCDAYEIPDFAALKAGYTRFIQFVMKKHVLSAQHIDESGIAGAISKMCFGNMLGMTFEYEWSNDNLFAPEIGSLIFEADGDLTIEEISQHFYDIDFQYLGKTSQTPAIYINNQAIMLEDALKAWTEPLEKIFPMGHEAKAKDAPALSFTAPKVIASTNKFAKPRVFIPIFPGTNGEYETAKAFEKAGGLIDTFVLRNLTPGQIKDSINILAEKISQSQIIALPGGSSAGGEPDGAGKFIAALFKNPALIEAIHRHLANDGLILGISDGFQALIKLGLLPYGEICGLSENSPTLTYNAIGRHVSAIVGTKIVSDLSPWFNKCDKNEIYYTAFSNGEGRFIAGDEELQRLAFKGQIATQYVDFNGSPAMGRPYNPSGSLYAVEGITSPDGRILGKMTLNERSLGEDTLKNIPGNKIQPIFASGIHYYK